MAGGTEGLLVTRLIPSTLGQGDTMVPDGGHDCTPDGGALFAQRLSGKQRRPSALQATTSHAGQDLLPLPRSLTHAVSRTPHPSTPAGSRRGEWHYFLCFRVRRALPAVRRAIAIACFCDLPWRISVRMLRLIVFREDPRLRGMITALS